MERIDQSTEQQWVSAAVYGKSGSGKTSMGVTAPKPLILLSEKQGLLHVKQAAQRLGIPIPPTLYMERVNDYRAVCQALYGDRSEPFRVFEKHGDEKILTFEGDWPETIVIDSLTDAARLISDEIHQVSPPKTGRDGLPVDAQGYWKVLGERVRNLILRFRDAPVHKLFLCLADDRTVGDEGDQRRSVAPDLPMRRLPDTLAAAVNVIGYAYRREQRLEGKPTRLVYGVMTVGPEYLLLKPCRPLRDAEVPDFSYWVKAIQGDLAIQPDAPAPSTESLAATDAGDQFAAAALEVAAAALGSVEKTEEAKPKATKKSKKAEVANAEG